MCRGQNDLNHKISYKFKLYDRTVIKSQLRSLFTIPYQNLILSLNGRLVDCKAEIFNAHYLPRLPDKKKENKKVFLEYAAKISSNERTFFFTFELLTNFFLSFLHTFLPSQVYYNS